jgi:hypothetical protein
MDGALILLVTGAGMLEAGGAPTRSDHARRIQTSAIINRPAHSGHGALDAYKIAAARIHDPARMVIRRLLNRLFE